jgi:hypothetical protein
VGPGGEQVRKGEGLAVEGQQYKAGWEGCLKGLKVSSVRGGKDALHE